ncbi:phosphatase PAP2 family protein [Oryzibacter oryziterrae]|uniref:phosphatase PAP2 family protein n=1 Tax=Oryzibacter oryziterrae TaxID=2766474 RepID=UPI001F2978E2|nr:phosphatase PAP2 family protein [Oryzibacter oryziterrae]
MSGPQPEEDAVRQGWLVRSQPHEIAGLCGFYALLALCAVSLFFYACPEVDLAVSRWFYRAGDGFVLADWELFRRIRQMGVNDFTLLLAAAALGLIVPLVTGGRQFLAPPRWSAAVLIAAVTGPGLLVNALFKDHWGRARPVQLLEFGGTAPFSKVWVIAGNCASNCSFASGEGSSSILFLTLVLAVPRAWRPATAAVTGALALLLSLNRIAFGGHFLSDVLVSWCLSILCFSIAFLAISHPASNLSDDGMAAWLGRFGARCAGWLGRRS